MCKVNFVARGFLRGSVPAAVEQLWLLWVHSEEFLCAVVAAMGCRAQPSQAEHTNKTLYFQILAAIYGSLVPQERL